MFWYPLLAGNKNQWLEFQGTPFGFLFQLTEFRLNPASQPRSYCSRFLKSCFTVVHNYGVKHHFKEYKRRIDSSHFPLCPRNASLTSQISWWLTDEAANDRYDGSYEAGPVSRWNWGWVDLIHKWDITHLLSGMSCQGCLYIYIYIQRERELWIVPSPFVKQPQKTMLE